MALYCVYCHTNTVNGKRYFGQTINNDNPEIRWGKNGSGYSNNAHFFNAIKKYGWDAFDHYVLQKDLTKEEADELETLNIVAYNTINPDFGYNKTLGGEGTSGYHLSDESKQKISISKQGIPAWNKGIPMSEEQRQRFVGANNPQYGKTPYNKGISCSDSAKQKMSASWDYDKHFTKETRKKIGDANKNYYKEHPEAISKRTEAMIKARKRPIEQYDAQGNLIAIYSSMSEASQYGFNHSQISQCCSGKKKNYKGYVWKYTKIGGND